MTVQTLGKKIAPLRPPIDWELAHFLRIAPPQPIHDRKTYRAYIEIMGHCLETLESGEAKGSQAHALREYVKVIRPLMAEYENKEFPMPRTTQAEVLMFLMEQNNLAQEDLSDELGGQPAVSYVLNGKRSLNAEQIKKLSKRFHISPAVFFP